MEQVEAEMMAAEAENTFATDDMPDAEPVKLLSGQFQGADSFHQGSGDAGIYELDDGSLLLRFDDIDVTNGPDLHVILSPVGSAEDRDDVMTPGYMDLGGLKGNRGSQNYDIPAGVGRVLRRLDRDHLLPALPRHLRDGAVNAGLRA